MDEIKRLPTGRIAPRKFYTYKDKTQSVREWALEYGIEVSSLRHRLAVCGDDIERALKRKPKKKPAETKTSAGKEVRDLVLDVIVANRDEFRSALEDEFHKNPLGYFKSYAEKLLPKEQLAAVLNDNPQEFAEYPVINIQVNNGSEKTKNKQKTIDLGFETRTTVG